MHSPSKTHALTACRRLLAPVARLLLRSGITWKDFADLSKAVFVDIATRDFGLNGRPTNMSRVSVMTGINRHEVSRLREELDSLALPVPTYMNAAQRLLSGWHQDPEFLDDHGAPLALPIHGPSPSFDALCKRYGGDMPPTALLRELRIVDVVEESPAGTVRALGRSYVQSRLDPEKVLRAGSVLEDLGNTVVFDLTAPPDQRLRFERRAENDSVDPDHLPAFQAFLEQKGMEFLEQVDSWLTQHQVDNNRPSAKAGIRLGVGVFHIQDEARRGAHR